MTLYTTMPLEIVMEGWSEDPPPMLELTFGETRLLLAPVAPGVGRIVRLVAAPLDHYLRPEYAPGQLICFGDGGSVRQMSFDTQPGIGISDW
ncbi:YlzJ-like family protein [Cohnella nanjingensis]|uniref:YlzJ-like family protein n=1 Tax=Cohnella nanjingensis TaxID=1387779 RepID=A0A7X0RSF1_9BACL|nr:YlzJ-like family protein [Cohnella nanjingensis]MBB6672854.1 YlzJ-like family protein [Cohnella nanjingensis]